MSMPAEAVHLGGMHTPKFLRKKVAGYQTLAAMHRNHGETQKANGKAARARIYEKALVYRLIKDARKAVRP